MMLDFYIPDPVMNQSGFHGRIHKLGGGFKYFLMFTPKPGEMIPFDLRIFFQMGWFNHQLYRNAIFTHIFGF